MAPWLGPPNSATDRSREHPSAVVESAEAEDGESEEEDGFVVRRSRRSSEHSGSGTEGGASARRQSSWVGSGVDASRAPPSRNGIDSPDFASTGWSGSFPWNRSQTIRADGSTIMDVMNE